MHVIVIGAGVIGAAIADALAARGATVSVLDMRSPGRGASQASAGVLAPFTEASGKAALFDLCARSLALYEGFIASLIERSGRQVEYVRNGTVEIALTADEATHLKSAQAWLADHDVACEWLEPVGLRRHEPSVAPEAAGGLAISSQGFVNVPALVGALVQAARLAGATVESQLEAIEVIPRRDRAEVRAGSERYAADHVVIAAGSWSSRVRVANVPALPVRPIRGQLLHVRWNRGPMPTRVVWGHDCYTVPWHDGTLLVGATVEDVGFDEASTVDGVRSLTDAVARLLPDARHAALAEVRVGLRPASPDGLPLIGPLTMAPTVTLATGHYRNGILLAPLTARLVASSILDGLRDPMLSLTTPDRFIRPIPHGARV
ncbi:MAG TPA: glycine oxidase ThiO [Vicinamibacterales bacterium]|nr:glycine oxidase ThiO [Vicinamibacterales bacterium]